MRVLPTRNILLSVSSALSPPGPLFAHFDFLEGKARGLNLVEVELSNHPAPSSTILPEAITKRFVACAVEGSVRPRVEKAVLGFERVDLQPHRTPVVGPATAVGSGEDAEVSFTAREVTLTAPLRSSEDAELLDFNGLASSSHDGEADSEADNGTFHFLMTSSTLGMFPLVVDVTL